MMVVLALGACASVGFHLIVSEEEGAGREWWWGPYTSH